MLTITNPRYFGLNKEFSFIAGFNDASQRCYSAVLYYVITHNGQTNASLLASKTKLASLKTQSNPRLELCGALLLADELRLHKLPSKHLKLYTDSQIVLAWLKLPPHTLNNFIANRVMQILELTVATGWYYINTSDNPAD